MTASNCQKLAEKHVIDSSLTDLKKNQQINSFVLVFLACRTVKL